MSTSFSDTMLRYLDQIQQSGIKDWEPHPMIKALILALDGARRDGKDGNYSGVSGDAALAGGNSSMTIMVIVSATNGRYTIQAVRHLDHNIELRPDWIEKIIHSETLMEKYRGDTLPVKDFMEIARDMGVNVAALQPEEITPALKHTQDMILEGNAPNVPSQTRKAILQLSKFDKTEWESLDSITRSTVASMYGPVKYNGNTLMITTDQGNFEKWKARNTLLTLLEQGFVKA